MAGVVYSDCLCSSRGNNSYLQFVVAEEDYYARACVWTQQRRRCSHTRPQAKALSLANCRHAIDRSSVCNVVTLAGVAVDTADPNLLACFHLAPTRGFRSISLDSNILHFRFSRDHGRTLPRRDTPFARSLVCPVACRRCGQPSILWRTLRCRRRQSTPFPHRPVISADTARCIVHSSSSTWRHTSNFDDPPDDG